MCTSADPKYDLHTIVPFVLPPERLNAAFGAIIDPAKAILFDATLVIFGMFHNKCVLNAVVDS